MTEPSVASAFEGKDLVSDFGGRLADHYRGAVTGEKDAFTGETAIQNIPGLGSAYQPFKDGYTLVKDVRSGEDTKALAGDVKDVASDTWSLVSEARGAIADPLGWLIQKGLGFLEDVVFPLKEMLELVTGDPEALEKSAEQFDAIAADLKKLAENVEQAATQGCQVWAGEAAPAAGQKIGETKRSIEETAQAAGHVATMLKVSSMLMQAAYDIINGIIADVIEQLVITWVAAQAAAPVTLGASEAAAAGASAAEVGIGVARATPKIAKVTEILQKITQFIQKVLRALKGSVGKLLNETKVGGKFLQQEIKEGEKVVQKAGAGREGLDALGTTRQSLEKDLGREVDSGELFGRHVRDHLDDWVKHSAKEHALEQLGLPSERPQGAKEWLEAGEEFATKAREKFEDVQQAVEYSTDPGAQAEEDKNAKEKGGKD
ncbi:WXG100 family type VII secretion target [Gandjariella thermophila]|uniref:Uncharacterized protein n=1 Tax=Gandjariella thermophila TaxID=1931992 RepID=A0A4D4J3M5_9PSEU|nr:hypothetical protein [Gandjariella thermophila]GDY29358.1 hypothetical protein GTS_09910 [Gandjariella thermophila]